MKSRSFFLSLAVLSMLSVGPVDGKDPPEKDEEPTNLKTKPESTLTGPQVFAKASPAVVKVLVYDERSKLKGQGSGFFVSPDGLLATNYHVIAKAASARVKLADSTELSVAGIVASNQEADLALLRVKGKKFPHLELAEATPKVGATVYALGSPKGLTNTFTQGVISGYREFKGMPRLLQTSAPISQGSSGGPLLAGSGEVIGVTTIGLGSGQNLNFAVPSKYLKSLMLRRREIRPLPGKDAVQESAPTRSVPKTYSSLSAILDDMPDSIFPVKQKRGHKRGKAVEWTYIRMKTFNMWAKDKLVGQRLSLLLTKESGGRIRVFKWEPDGSVRLFFPIKEEHEDVPRWYELEAKLSTPSAANLTAASEGRTARISGKIARFRLCLNRGPSKGVIEANKIIIGVALDDCEVVLCKLIPKHSIQPKVRPRMPQTRPARVPTPEEKAMAKLGLAKAYVANGKKQRALAVLRAILTEFRGTEAAKQAKEELLKMGFEK